MINVAYSSSNEYFEITLASIKSLIFNTTDAMKIYLVSDNISNENINRLKKIIKKSNNSLKVIDFNEYIYRLKDASQYIGSYSTYAKLFLFEMCNEDKIIFIDSDTIILSNIKEIYDINLNNKIIGGVKECLDNVYYQIANMNASHTYINAGILLINLELWRKEKMDNLVLSYIRDHNNIPNVDQGLINAVFKDKIEVLDLKFNLMPQPIYYKDCEKIKKIYNMRWYYTDDQISNAIKNPVIVHFVGTSSTPYIRPWIESYGEDHPYKNMFLKFYEGKILWQDDSFYKKIKYIIWYFLPFNILLCIEKILNVRRKRIILRTFGG